jgi:carbon monoxide dehydrogenase subunit G
MNLSGTYTFQAEQRAVWDLMMNPDAIASALPGVDEFVPIEAEANAWNVKLKVSLAAVNGSYAGTIRMSDQEPPNQYRLTVNGEGQQSIIGGNVLIRLDYDDAKNETLLTWDAEANISGKLARIGQRVIKAAGNMMSNRFFNNLAQQLSTGENT